jgi:hypothetical protein
MQNEIMVLNLNCLKIDMWNIKGLTTEKANDPHFQNIISKFNITSFVETWIGESTQDIVPSLLYFSTSLRRIEYTDSISLVLPLEYSGDISTTVK